MFKNVYSHKRVFVTGHTGFKGSWLTAWLQSLGAEVVGYSKDIPTQPALFSVLGLEKVQDIRADVQDSQMLMQSIQEFRPHIVFHLAAQALVQTSYVHPSETFETNALGTLHVLEAVRNTPSVQAVVCITSDKCYKNNEWVYGYREQDALGGMDPYSASKACAEIIAQSYFQSFFHSNGPACATVRAGNVIGGGDWAKDRIVPDCAKAWAAGEPVHIRNPYATRPWQHVLEPLSGYLWLGAKLLLKENTPYMLRGESYNFGPEMHVVATVGEVVDTLAQHWPQFLSHKNTATTSAAHECNLLKLCCDKALAHLQWQATYDFEESVRATAQWYKNYHLQENGNMLAYTLEQIATYVQSARKKGLLWAQE